MVPAVRITTLGKRYRVTHAQERVSYRTLRDSLSRAVAAPLRRLRGETNGAAEDFWALKDVSFDIAPGEVVGIIGDNGAGKSTLLKILSRITKPTTGSVEINGRVGSLLEVGTGFHPELSGRENIFMNGSILGMSRYDIQLRFGEIVEFAGIGRFLDTPVKRYSSGMYVRLAFAVAAHLDPEILIIDEVLAVGDSSFQKKCLGKLSEMSRDGRTVLFVSHNMGAIAGLCSQAIWLSDGSVKMNGPAQETVDAFLHASVESMSSRLVLKTDRHRLYSNALRLTELEWLSGIPIRHGKRTGLRLHFEITAPAADVSFAIGFSAPGGNRLLTYDSDYGGARVDFDACGHFYTDLEIPQCPLAPGTYVVDVAARSGDASVLDYLPNCAFVDISPSTETPPYFLRHPGAGVRLHAQWGHRLNTAATSCGNTFDT